MEKYHKIQTVFKRDGTSKNSVILGQYSIPEFEYLKDIHWEWAEKLNGTNIRIQYEQEQEHISFKGKTDNADIHPKLLAELNDFFTPFVCTKFRSMFKKESNICLYGEGIGPGVNKGSGLYGPGYEFVLFDVNIDGWWLQRKDVEDIAQKMGLQIAPLVGYGPLIQMVDTAYYGFNSQWGDFKAEGLVARPTTGLQTRGGDRIITKIKYKDFLRE